MKRSTITVLALLFVFAFSTLAYTAEAENLSKGKPYTVTALTPLDSHHEIETRDYPDEKNAELTDGHIAAKEHYAESQFVGFLRQGGREIVIDLGKVADVAEVTIRFLCQPDVGIGLPTSVSVGLSDEGKLWSAPVTKVIQDSIFTEIVTVSLKPATSGRYVKVSFPINVWVFTDEITVLGSWAE